MFFTSQIQKSKVNKRTLSKQYTQPNVKDEIEKVIQSKDRKIKDEIKKKTI